MAQYQYSPRILIQGVEGTHITNAVAVTDKVGKKFISLVKDALKKLAKLPTGQALLNEINAGAHNCVIFLASKKNATEWNDNCSQGNPDGVASEVNCSVVSFRPRQKNIPIMGTAQKKTMRLPGDGKAKSAFEGQQKGFLQGVGGNALQTKAQAAPELDVILTRAGSGDLARGRSLASMLTGVSVQHLTDMAQGTRVVTDNTYYKICFYFYDHLTPGPGVDTCIRIAPSLRLLSPNGSYKPKTDYQSVAPEIILGHELIHTWRKLKGRRVVRQGWEEEAMTTGIGMFRPWRFTENRLRAEAKYPERPTYSNGVISCIYAYNQKEGLNLADDTY